jgi:hypothetical protein
VIVALNHHEKGDGNGCPGNVNSFNGNVIAGHDSVMDHLSPSKEEEIPILGRAVSLTDIYMMLSVPAGCTKSDGMNRICWKNRRQHREPTSIPLGSLRSLPSSRLSVV